MQSRLDRPFRPGFVGPIPSIKELYRQYRHKFHAAARRLPPMTQAMFEALVRDISRNGLRRPIIWFQGLILDGVWRFLACEVLGISTRGEQAPPDADPESFVMSANLIRRSYSRPQLAAVAVTFVESLLSEEECIERAAGGSPVDRHQRQTSAILARRFGIGIDSVEAAMRIQRDAPACFVRMLEGEFATVAEADRAAFGSSSEAEADTSSESSSGPEATAGASGTRPKGKGRRQRRGTSGARKARAGEGGGTQNSQAGGEGTQGMSVAEIRAKARELLSLLPRDEQDALFAEFGAVRQAVLPEERGTNQDGSAGATLESRVGYNGSDVGISHGTEPEGAPSSQQTEPATGPSVDRPRVGEQSDSPSAAVRADPTPTGPTTPTEVPRISPDILRRALRAATQRHLTTQRSVARVLGVNPATISRFAGGSANIGATKQNHLVRHLRTLFERAA